MQSEALHAGLDQGVCVQITGVGGRGSRHGKVVPQRGRLRSAEWHAGRGDQGLTDGARVSCGCGSQSQNTSHTQTAVS